MFYHNLPGTPTEKNPTGNQIRQVSVTVKLETGVSRYEFEERSSLERNLLVGLWVTKPGVQIDETYSSPAAAVLDSGKISLRHQSDEVYEAIPLEHIRLCNEQGRPYYVSLPGSVNLSESKLHIANSAAIAANTAIQIQADFVRPSIRRR